ncbi:MAG: hypothetical protein AAFQ41_03105 [Cyanobacteria bacterium J06623_7]
MPIRSPRILVEIETITRNLDDDPTVIDEAPGQTENGLKTNLFVKMKKGIAEYLGFEPMAWNDPRLLGVFGGHGTNLGAQYTRRLGGFRVASYTLISKSVFNIREEFYDADTGLFVDQTSPFRTMSIGLPTGHSVHEFITTLSGANNFEQIAAIRTPAGRKIDIYEP